MQMNYYGHYRLRTISKPRTSREVKASFHKAIRHDRQLSYLNKEIQFNFLSACHDYVFVFIYLSIYLFLITMVIYIFRTVYRFSDAQFFVTLSVQSSRLVYEIQNFVLKTELLKMQTFLFLLCFFFSLFFFFFFSFTLCSKLCYQPGYCIQVFWIDFATI